MSKQKNIETTGVVTEALGNSIFRVRLINDHIIIAHLSGKIRMNSIRIIPSDHVIIEMSLYDMSKGRIVRRLNEKPGVDI